MAEDEASKSERLRAAGARFEARRRERERTQVALAIGGPLEADTPERVRANVNWRATTALRRIISPLERILGPRDLVDVPSTATAAVAAKPVARIIEVPDPGFEPRGFGTGFLIAPDILITNNHVFPSFADALASAANFGYVRADGRIASGTVHTFSENPDEFLTDEELDFTLVALKEDPGLGCHRLYGTVGKILLGQPMNIIQHPQGGPRQYGVEANELVDILNDHLHYTTDTEPGSSGSPAFNTEWEVVALHHSGVPRMRGGVILNRQGKPWDGRTMSDDDIDWVANEGIRASRIVERLRERKVREPRFASLIDRVLGTARDTVEAIPAVNSTTFSPGDSTMTTIHIHAPTVIYTGKSDSATAPPVVFPSPARPVLPLDSFEGISIDPNYANRPGYVPAFLGQDFEVALPTIAADDRIHIAPLIGGDAAGILKYHHFSIVMRGDRKLPFFTAVNIDGKRGKRPARETDKWFFDPRLDRKYQVGEELYRANPLDRGHLVRRLDPAWGTQAIAKIANDDTFHFTNCSPQHQNLNQKIWADLEDYLLDHAQDDDVKLTVFTGPVFDSNDPRYRDMQLPRRFWKVAVMRDQQGKPLTAGFVQSQRKMIANLKEADFLRQEMRTDQCKVSQIEALTHLRFGLAAEADALHGEPDAPIAEAIGVIGRRLESLEDIKLR